LDEIREPIARRPLVTILLAADVHGDHDLEKLSDASLLSKTGLGPNQIDFLIVLGDWGVIWNDDPVWLAKEAQLLAFYDSKPWETLVILGNHEGYARVRRLPISKRYGGTVRRASEKVYILESANIFLLGGMRFFIFDGAESVDKANREDGIDWWAEEIPTSGEVAQATSVLEGVNGCIDFVLTHTCPTDMAEHLLQVDSIFRPKALDPTCRMLSILQGKVQGSPPWFFGHFHVDLCWRNFRCLYEDLLILRMNGESADKEPLPGNLGAPK
jgi:hypothetical protein